MTFRIFRQTRDVKNGKCHRRDEGSSKIFERKTTTTVIDVVYSTSSFSFSSFYVLFVFLLCAVVTFVIVLNHPVGPREGT